MYSSSSVLALRAKGSLYHGHHPPHHHHHHHHHRCFSGDRAAEGCGCCCSLGTAHLPCAAAVGFSDRASVFASPSLLYAYWLRQSALIRWVPSRIIVSSGGGAASAARYSRLKAAWDGDPCPDGEWGRWRKCGNSRVSGRVGASDEGFEDMLGLLAEVEDCFGQDDGVAADGPAEDTYVKEKVRFKSHGGSRRRFYDSESDASMEDDRKLNSSYHSASSFSSISGDSRRSKDFRRRGRDESSSSHCRNDEIAKKEVREVRKHEKDSRLRRRYHASDSILGLDSDSRKKEERTGDGDDNTVSLTGSVHQSRERYVQKDQRFTGQKETKEELQKVSKTSHVRQNSATERSIVDKNMVNVIKEETSAAALLEVVRKQQDEMIQLRKDYQDLLRTTQVHNVSATKASASCSIFNTKVENLSENSTLPMGLLEEVRRQRSDIEQLNENCRQLMRSSKMQEDIIIRESNSTKSFRTVLENRDETSTSVVNLVEDGTVHYYNMDKQTFDDSRAASAILTGTNELQKYHQQLKTSDIHEGDIQTTTNYKKCQSTTLEDREEKAISVINLVEEVQEHHTNITQDQQKLRHTDLETNTHKLTERADIYNTSIETASRSQRHRVTTISDPQECTSSAVKWTGEREEQVSNVNEKLIGHIDLRGNSQKPADIVEIHKNGATKSLRTQDHVKTTVKDQAECSTSVQHLVKLTKDERIRIDQHVIEEINVSKDTQTRINISEAFVGEVDNATTTFSDHLRNEDGEQAIQQFRLRNDSQQRAPESFEGDPVNVSDSQILSTKKPEKTDDHPSLVFIQDPKEKQKNNLEKQKNNLVEGALGASSGTSESWYTSGSMQTHELDYHTENDGLDLVKGDVLESARRLANSSSHYIGEFVDQLNQKVSVSEEVDTTSYNSPETQIEASQQSPSQKAATEQEDELGKEEPREYSSRSEVGGPSDEMWDVRGASSKEPSPTEEQEKDSSSVQILATASTPASTSGAIIKRSSKSLWSYIADIVRMGWRPHTSSQKSMLKSDTRSSSNESLNSDAWYSGHEPEDDQEENVKNGRSELNKAAVGKPHSRTSSLSGRVASEVRRQGKKRMQDELDASIPTGIIGGSYGSHGSPPAPSLESLVPVDTGKGIEGIPAVAPAIVPSAVTTASQSALLGSTSVSTSEEETEIYRGHVTDVGSIKPKEGQKTERISEVVGLGGKDVELKQRKLQRKKQVLREEFEEWEEAYKLETEQRKVDEFFMREALLEAKKAADMWEVPVGAVLVQDGKIIARGCNLVEDLRDSTAHAEMICIREASSLLRTWRLAGTTLYMTLEPCPMCAGAILQARIDVVVWGAPNKLLGADGSWVRLFPGGDEGKQGLDQSDQVVGPVHPFHPKITIRRGVLAMECADAMQQFFQRRRKKKKSEPPPPSCLPINYPAKILTKMHNIFSMMACM